MNNKRTQRVALTAGILFVLSLMIFGSLIAVAWMSLDNTVVVTSDAYSTEGNGPHASTALAWRIDPNLVRSIDYREAVRTVDFRIDPNLVRSIDYREAVRTVDLKEAVRTVDFRIDPNLVRSIDLKEAVRMVDFKDSERVIHYNTLWEMSRLID